MIKITTSWTYLGGRVRGSTPKKNLLLLGNLDCRKERTKFNAKPPKSKPRNCYVTELHDGHDSIIIFNKRINIIMIGIDK